MLAVAWSSIQFLWRPEQLYTEDFLSFEHGQNLFLVDQLLAGKRLYRDIFSQYGPLPAYAHAAVAWLFGNTAATYLHLAQALSVLDGALLYLLLRRAARSPWQALLWLAVVIYPCFLIPGAGRGIYLWTIYPGFERAVLLALALAWAPPRTRTVRQAAWLGALLGVLQLVKFAAVVPIGVALIVADVLVSGRELLPGSPRLLSPLLRRWLGQGIIVLGVFLAIEAIWAGWLLATLPAAQAAEVLWPDYLLESYRSYVTPDMRYLHWHGASHFRNLQLPVAVALGLNSLLLLGCLLPIPRWLTGIWRAPDRAILECHGWALLLAAYFPIALAVYLPHYTAAWAYEWTFLAAAFFAFTQLRSVALRTLTLAVCLGGVYYNILELHRRRGLDDTVPVPLGVQGERLWLKPASRDAVAKLQETVVVWTRAATGAVETKSSSPPPQLLFVPATAGWSHYLGYRTPPMRHQWFMPAFVARAEESKVVAALDTGTVAVVVATHDPAPRPLTPDPRTWLGADPRFDPATDAAITARLGQPVQLSDHLTLFPVR